MPLLRLWEGVASPGLRFSAGCVCVKAKPQPRGGKGPVPGKQGWPRSDSGCYLRTSYLSNSSSPSSNQSLQLPILFPIMVRLAALDPQYLRTLPYCIRVNAIPTFKAFLPPMLPIISLPLTTGAFSNSTLKSRCYTHITSLSDSELKEFTLPHHLLQSPISKGC